MIAKKNLKWIVIVILGLMVWIAIISTFNENQAAAAESEAVVTDTLSQSTTEQVVAEPKSNWAYDTTEDKMTSSTKYYAWVDAKQLLDFDFPYNGGSTATLQIRSNQNNNDITFRVSKGQIVTGNQVEGGSTRVRFDDEKPFTVSVTYPSDYSSDVIFLGSEKKLINKLKTAKKFLIEVEFYNEGIKQIEFDVEGLEWEH